MIEVADDDILWFSLDEDDATYEEPLEGDLLQFWCPQDECAYVGYVDQDGEVQLFNMEDAKEVTHYAEYNLDE